jgi:4'-phosphopantetheinyl transferase EntD
MNNDTHFPHPKYAEGSDAGAAGWTRHYVEIATSATPLLAHVIEFSPNALKPTAFAHASIDYPESIQRSVYKRQMEFFFGRLAARDALSQLGLAGRQIPIGAERQPIWPIGVTGSITHTHGLAAAVAERLGVCRGIGIDAEQMIDQETCQSVSSVVVGPHELDYLHSLQELSLQMALTIVFSAKESFYKAAYAAVGHIFDFSAVRAAELDVRKQRLTLVLNETLSEQFCRGQICEAGYTFVRPDTVLTHVVW